MPSKPVANNVGLNIESFLDNLKFYENKRIEKRAFIDKMPISDDKKKQVDRMTPDDAFDFMNEPLERFFFVQKKLMDCKLIGKKLTNAKGSLQKLKESKEDEQTFWLEAAKTAAKTLKEHIQQATGTTFKNLKNQEDDIRLAAQDMRVEVLFPRELFEINVTKEAEKKIRDYESKHNSWLCYDKFEDTYKRFFLPIAMGGLENPLDSVEKEILRLGYTSSDYAQYFTAHVIEIMKNEGIIPSRKDAPDKHPQKLSKITEWNDVTFKYDIKTACVRAEIKGKHSEMINPTNLEKCYRNKKPTPRWGYFLQLIKQEDVKTVDKQRVNESLAAYFNLPKDFPKCFTAKGCGANIPINRKVRLNSHGSERRGGKTSTNEDDSDY